LSLLSILESNESNREESVVFKLETSDESKLENSPNLNEKERLMERVSDNSLERSLMIFSCFLSIGFILLANSHLISRPSAFKF
jgi:hypothetical protein